MNDFPLFRRVAWLMLCAMGAFFLFGCATYIRRATPPLQSYHDTQPGIPIRRVAMLPLFYEREPGGVPSNIDIAFHSELTKTTLFEVVWIDRAQLKSIVDRWQISSVEKVPANLLPALAEQFGVDAVLFTDVTHYFPYQPISIGIRCKLVDAHSGEIRWAFDHLFDSGKPPIAQEARRFYLVNSQTNLPIGNDGNSVLQSPQRFASYAAWESYRSLLNKPPDMAVPCP